MDRTDSRIAELERRLAAAESALEAAEARIAAGERFAKLVEHASDMLSILGADGEVFYMSPVFERLTGFALEHVLGRRGFDTIHPEDVPRVREALLQLAASGAGRTQSLEYRRRHKNGGWIRLEAIGRNLLADPAVRGIVVTARDVTARHDMEVKLRGAQLRYELALQASNDGLWDWDVAGHAVYISPRANALLGYDAGELQPTPELLRELLHAEDRERVTAAFALHLEREEPLDVEARVLTKGGDHRWFRVAGQAHRDADGRPLRMVGCIGDIHERKLAELALRESENRFRALFEGTATAVTLRDVEAQLLLDCNAAAVRLFGCTSREELLGTHPLMLSPEHQADGAPSGTAARAHIARAFEEKAYQFEWLYRKVTGDVFPTEVQVTVLDLAGRRIFLSIITDLTVTKAAERVLAKAKEDAVAASMAKSAFLANMSHELRTPLNGVIGMVGLLADTQLDERQRRYTDVARDSARLLLSVINDILDFSKIEAGKLDLEETDFSLVEVVEEVASILALGAETKGLELTCRADPALSLPLVGDPARVRQVLVNLVNNAIKFTPRGEITVGATATEDADGVLVEVEVKDTGIGIAEDAQARLFQPFSQIDASSTREHHGSGLGLAICRELVERMGGQIGVRSALGRGSAFWFRLLLPRSPRGALVDDGSAIEARLAGARVLGVDDNATNRELLQAELRAAGMICDTAADGPSALQALLDAADRAPYAIAVLDHHMPGMSGVELAHRVKAEPRIRSTRLVMLGSVGHPLDRAARIAAGISGYASKPIWRRRLLRVLAAALEGPDPVADGAPRAADRAPLPSAATSGRRILLVEDSPISGEVAGEILRSAGHAFDLAVDGAQAVEAAESARYDLVLMDCQLPVMDGFETTRRIRELEREGRLPRGGSGRIPIIALTASATRDDLDRCLAVGMDDHIAKPVDARRLLALIAARLDPGPAPSLAVADLGAALDRLLGNRSLLATLVGRFRDGAPAERARLHDALDKRDAKALAFAAHRLRGQSSSFGAEALGARAAALEAAARREDWTAADEEVRAVDREIDRLLLALSA